MNINDENNSKKAAFDTWDSLEEKIDKLTSMMSKFTAQDGQNMQFKPKIFQKKKRADKKFL